MKYLAAYLLCTIAGNDNPNFENIEKVFGEAKILRSRQTGQNVTRVQKELADMRSSNSPFYKMDNVDDGNIWRWTLLISPKTEPYNEKAFKMTIEFPPEYPFKPPVLKFDTKMFHPSVSESGQICPCCMKSIKNWKPATQTQHVIEELLSLIAAPRLCSSLCFDFF
uniref:UBC core domain-containing protein n=1 Tax=Ditylenchus dipsaci TaxID=166011 RepID=A0A915EG34_9BILA